MNLHHSLTTGSSLLCCGEEDKKSETVSRLFSAAIIIFRIIFLWNNGITGHANFNEVVCLEADAWVIMRERKVKMGGELCSNGKHGITYARNGMSPCHYSSCDMSKKKYQDVILYQIAFCSMSPLATSLCVAGFKQTLSNKYLLLHCTMTVSNLSSFTCFSGFLDPFWMIFFFLPTVVCGYQNRLE